MPRPKTRSGNGQFDDAPHVSRLSGPRDTMLTQEGLICINMPTSWQTMKSKGGLVLIGFLIIAGALLFTEHRAHVLGLLVWLPLLACPLMHMFMHGGMVATRVTINQPTRGGRRERRYGRLWPMESCQLRSLHLFLPTPSSSRRRLATGDPSLPSVPFWWCCSPRCMDFR